MADRSAFFYGTPLLINPPSLGDAQLKRFILRDFGMFTKTGKFSLTNDLSDGASGAPSSHIWHNQT